MPHSTFLLVRHGETDDNKNSVFQGQQGRGLNARGRDQAARLGARLAHASLRPAALYSSDLERAQETASILGRALGLEPSLDADLREVYLGAWQGLSHTAIAERFPDEWAAWRVGRDIHRGGGETYAEVRDRMTRAMDRIADAHDGATIVVVSHGASLKSFAAHVLGMDMSKLKGLHAPANTAVAVVERELERRWRLALWNDVAHLRDAVVEGIDG